MATYKVPQDVEADDKLIGFLSLKQFIFVVVALLLSVAAFQLAKFNVFLLVPFIPFIAVFAILGLYQRKDQPAEVYLLAMLNFYFKPHNRIWNQDGVTETLNITVPKQEAHQYTDNLSKDEVKSRLGRLSTMMDTRGWAAKNAEFQTNVVVPNANQPSDRLIAVQQTAFSEPDEIHDSDDMLDVASNPTAQSFDTMMQKATEHMHEEALAHMHEEPVQPVPTQQPPVATNSQLSETPHYNPAPVGIHQKVLSPVHDPVSIQEEASTAQIKQNIEATAVPSPNQDTSTMTPPTSDAILNLADRRDDNLSVETIAKEAQRLQSLDSDETVSLH